MYNDPQNARPIDEFVCEVGGENCGVIGFAECWTCNAVLCCSCAISRDGHEFCAEHAPMHVPATREEAYALVGRIDAYVAGSGWDWRTPYGLDLGNILWDFRNEWEELGNCADCGLPFWASELTVIRISNKPRQVCEECRMGRLAEALLPIIENPDWEAAYR